MKMKKARPDKKMKIKTPASVTKTKFKASAPATKRRKNTLLLEYKLMNKSNKFVDRRVGSRNSKMTTEDRIQARFFALQIKSLNKKQIFNLEKDEITHRGGTLEAIEKFDTTKSDSDDDDDGTLDAAFVKKAHFGGGLFSKTSDGGNSHKSTIQELIAESKRRKFERQMIKEETQTLTEKLDKDLKELFPVFNNEKSTADANITTVTPTPESYDLLVRQLKFEPVGKPCDKQKSDDQVMKEEKQKLSILEMERLERMKRIQELEDVDENKPTMEKHISADDLDDGFDLDVFTDEENEMSDESDCAEHDEGSENKDTNEKIDSEDHEERSGDNAENLKKGNNQNVTVQMRTSSIVPETLADLMKILCGKDTKEKIETIEDLIRLQKIHVGMSVKEPLKIFLKVLIEYACSLFTSSISKDSWDLVNRLCPILFELTQMSGDDIVDFMVNLLKEKHEYYSSRKEPNISGDTLIFLKIVPLLFPTSDYYHPVTTPTAVFISKILSENCCATLQCIIKGLFLATVMLEFTHLSKRYCPETLKFLTNVLYVAVPNFQDAYPPVHSKNKILVLNSDYSNKEISEQDLKLSHTLLLDATREDDETRISILYTTLRILGAFCQNYNSLPASNFVWLPILNLINKLPIGILPRHIISQVENLRDKIESMSKCSMTYLTKEKKRPKALRLYEPNIRPVIDGKSFRTVSQAKLEKEKLMHEYKREKKGAFREIRKDQKLLTRVKLSEQTRRDAERKDKVKRIFGWGQSQQSEFKMMERKNRYRK